MCHYGREIMKAYPGNTATPLIMPYFLAHWYPHNIAHYNTRKEYKYATVFALQKTGLTGFPQTWYMAENASLSEK